MIPTPTALGAAHSTGGIIITKQKQFDLTPVLHLLCTLQCANDEMDMIEESAKFAPFKQELKKATNTFIAALKLYRKQLKPTNAILENIWLSIPDPQEFGEFNSAKRRLIQRMAFAKFEEIREMDALLDDALYRIEQLDTFELMLNTHVPNKQLRESYRTKLNYTEAQYIELCKGREKTNNHAKTNA